MSDHLFSYIIIVIAVVLALAVTFLHVGHVQTLSIVSFLDKLLPMLAVGALLKYLLTNKLP